MNQASGRFWQCYASKRRMWLPCSKNVSFSKCLTLCNVWQKIITICWRRNFLRHIGQLQSKPDFVQTGMCVTEPVVPSSKTCSHGRPQIASFVKRPRVAGIARGLAVPTPRITGSLGSHKAGLWSSKQLETFLAIASISPARSLYQRPGNLALVSREWGSTSTWSWHIWPCLLFTLNSHKL